MVNIMEAAKNFRKRSICGSASNGLNNSSSSTETIVDVVRRYFSDGEDEESNLPLDLSSKPKRLKLDEDSTTLTCIVDLSKVTSHQADNSPLDLRLISGPKVGTPQKVFNKQRISTSYSTDDSQTDQSMDSSQATRGFKPEDYDGEISPTSEQGYFDFEFGLGDCYDDDDDDDQVEGVTLPPIAVGSNGLIMPNNFTAKPTFLLCNGSLPQFHHVKNRNSIDNEHWHCKSCSASTPAFSRKEDVERHERWHIRHQIWLTRGFLRCTPAEKATCLRLFPKCQNAGNPTHYHCLQPGCTKCCASTQEVQVHASSHQNDSALAVDGFQRFRATDICGNKLCPYFTAHTTHFHCKRPNCGYAFKVKADMEKHKIYHQRDDEYTRDGFRKFMKYQACSFANQGCHLSKIANHIHCLRCGYTLHSSGQLNSHRRKHDREDSETTVSQIPKSLPQKAKQQGLGNSNDPAVGPSGIRSAFQPVVNKINIRNPTPPLQAMPVFTRIAVPTPTRPFRVTRAATSVSNKITNPVTEHHSIKAEPEEKPEAPTITKVAAENIEIIPAISHPGQQCPHSTCCIYSGRNVEHFHCPLPSADNASAICSCSFTRLATLKLHLKAVHNHNIIEK